MTDELERKLQILINLQARFLVRDIESQQARVDFLDSCGLGNQDIANILGTTSGYVSVAKSKIKKARIKDNGNE
jgi:transcriptional regulator